jgi:hypothetical protein
MLLTDGSFSQSVLCYLFYDSVSLSECTASIEGWLMYSELEKILKETIVP